MKKAGKALKQPIHKKLAILDGETIKLNTLNHDHRQSMGVTGCSIID
ncbi:hypothetical protein [Paenibacillus antarcticus]|nr:hypothetical protein [Paenibacillus antarcticus]